MLFFKLMKPLLDKSTPPPYSPFINRFFKLLKDEVDIFKLSVENIYKKTLQSAPFFTLKQVFIKSAIEYFILVK